jgi:hypothetical protein
MMALASGANRHNIYSPIMSNQQPTVFDSTGLVGRDVSPHAVTAASSDTARQTLKAARPPRPPRPCGSSEIPMMGATFSKSPPSLQGGSSMLPVDSVCL